MRFPVFNRRSAISILSACSAGYLTDRSLFADTPASDNETPRGFAVVELFTSQGCSSCPPADRVLQDVQTVANERGWPVHVLSYHVDYWNRLGWRDPYSDPAWSERQRRYARRLQSNRVYTPQMIVNGTDAFVGSDRRQTIEAINRGLSSSTGVELSTRIAKPIAKHSLAPAHAKIDLRLRGNKQPLEVHAAMVTSPSPNDVPRGENAGRSLRHVHVVNSFRTETLPSGTHHLDLDIDERVIADRGRLIVMAQEPKTLQIVAATEQPLFDTADESDETPQ